MYYYVKKNNDGNLLVQESDLSKLIYYFILGGLGFIIGPFCFLSLISKGFSFPILIIFIISCFSIYGIFRIYKLKLKYIFYRDSNKVKYSIEENDELKEVEKEYIHIDIVKELTHRNLPIYKFVIFLKDKSFVVVDYFQIENQAQEVKKFCVEVLKKSIDYNPPNDSLETKTFSKAEAAGLMMEALRAVARGLV